MSALVDKQLFGSSKTIVDRKLAGRRHGGIEKGIGHIDGNFDGSGCGRGIEISEYLHHFRMPPVIIPNRLAAADARQGDAQRMIAKAGYDEERLAKAIVPRKGQGSHAASEAGAGIVELVRKLGIELQQGGSRAPELRGAAAMGVGFAALDARQHMAERLAGNILSRGAIEPPCAGRDGDGTFLEGWLFATAVTVADHDAVFEWPLVDG